MTDADYVEMTRDVEPPESYKPKDKGCWQKAVQLPVAIAIATAILIKPFFSE